MEYRLELLKDKLNISIKSEAEEREILLTNFERCQKGECDCPTEEYKKLQSLRIVPSDDKLSLILEPKPNQTFDLNEIRKCLDFTQNKLKG